jgi:hypothetical protein
MGLVFGAKWRAGKVFVDKPRKAKEFYKTTQAREVIERFAVMVPEATAMTRLAQGRAAQPCALLERRRLACREAGSPSAVGSRVVAPNRGRRRASCLSSLQDNPR